MNRSYDKLIEQFLNDNLNESERKGLFELVESNHEVKARFLELSEKWINSYQESPKEIREKRAKWIGIVKELEIATGAESGRGVEREMRVVSERGERRKFIRVFLYAASVAALVVGSFAIGLYYQKESSTTVEMVALDYSQKESKVERGGKTEVEVPNGSIISLKLPDGSKVWVNAGSTLAYNSTFGMDNRSLILKGEAYFEVAKQSNLPFNVNIDNITVTATGTAFNIEAYGGEVRTTLASGTVELTDELLQTKRLTPNQSIVYNSNNNNFGKVSKVNAALYSSWKEKVWVVRSMRLEEFLRRLEKRYDVIIIDEQGYSKDKYISASLGSETIEQILEALKSGMGMDYTMQKNRITINKISSRNFNN